MSMERVFVKNYTLKELEAWVESIGERRFRARQVFRHVYARRVRSWDECSDLSKMFRVQLEYGAHLDALELVESRESGDGTVKYLWKLKDGLTIESVLIPDPPRCTLCVSSQVGCALGCKFCLTGAMGFKRNLTVAEIVDQVCQAIRYAGSGNRITSLVFMGMGEPLANYDPVVRAMNILMDQEGLAFSHRRITLSTAGLVPRITQLGKDSPVNLAISLHAPDDELRSRIMPVNRKYPLADLMKACREYPIAPRKRITFEYTLLEGVNDDPRQAAALVKLLRGVKAKVNLIPFNPHSASLYKKPSEERVLAFQEVLIRANLTAIIRHTRGDDISAACGQLAARASGE